MKKSVFIVLFIFLVSSVFAKGIYITPKIQLKNGIAKEYLFEDSYKMSQLDWQVENVILVGFELDFELKHLYLGCDFSYGLCDLSYGLYNFDGKMEDYDWMDKTSSDYTHYSCHDLSVSKDFDFSVDIGLMFPLEETGKNYVNLFAQYNFKNTMFEAKNGWYHYDEQGVIREGELSGRVITYNPVIYSFLLGFGGNFYINETFSFKSETAISLLSFGICTDNHILTKDVWQDAVIGKVFLKSKLEFAFDFGNRFTMIFGGNVENLPMLQGQTYVNGYPSSNNTGGFSSLFYEFYFSYRIRIL